MMHRFYCANLAGVAIHSASAGAIAPVVELDEDESRHALRVLRLEAGAAVELMDGAGRVGRGVIAGTIGSRAHAIVTVRVMEIRAVPEAVPAIDLAVAAPKGARLDDMVPQLSQLNVATLIPLRTARGVADPRPARLDRLARAAIESAKQCGRAHVLRVAPMATLDEVLGMGHELKLMGLPPSGELGARRAGPEGPDLKNARRVLVLIGPEGGWTEEEIAQGRQAGCEAWALSVNILRIETAAAAAAAIAGYWVMEIGIGCRMSDV